MRTIIRGRKPLEWLPDQSAPLPARRICPAQVCLPDQAAVACTADALAPARLPFGSAMKPLNIYHVYLLLVCYFAGKTFDADRDVRNGFRPHDIT